MVIFFFNFLPEKVRNLDDDGQISDINPCILTLLLLSYLTIPLPKRIIPVIGCIDISDSSSNLN